MILEPWPQPDKYSGADPLCTSSVIALLKSRELWQLIPTGPLPFHAQFL